MAATTNLVCYIGTPGVDDRTWHWGLNADNSWYTLTGEWIDEGTTFRLDGNYTLEALRKAANHAITYYGPKTARLIHLYASDSSLGQNHKLLLGNGMPVIC